MATIVAVVIVAALVLVGVGLYANKIKPWHQPIVKVNGQVFDMDYFVRMLRLYGAKENPSQIAQVAQTVIIYIENNELVRQKAQEYDIDIDDITDEEIIEELKSIFGEDYNEPLETFLEERDVSRSDLEKLVIVPMILNEKLIEAIGDNEFGGQYLHARVEAVLVGTEEEALEINGKWNGDFNHIIKDYSPTLYHPQGGYWLVRVLEETEVDSEQQLHIEAMLLATREKAEELKAEIEGGGDFTELAKEHSLDSSAEEGGEMGWLKPDTIEAKFSPDVLELEFNVLSEPISQYYPDEAIEWLPEGIESSSVFEEFVFADGSESSGVSGPIRDVNSTTKGGYWLIMVYEPEEEEEHEEEGLYIKAILLDSNGGIDTVKSELDGGGDFAEIAMEYSLSSSSRNNGGDMGWLSLDSVKSVFGEDNLDYIQSLVLNTLSEPIYNKDTLKQSGYWVIQVLDKEERDLIENHQDLYIQEYYSAWVEEQNVDDYVLDDNDKIEWALEHL